MLHDFTYMHNLKTAATTKTNYNEEEEEKKRDQICIYQRLEMGGEEEMEKGKQRYKLPVMR